MARRVEMKSLPLQSTLLSTLEETICLQSRLYFCYVLDFVNRGRYTVV